MSREKEKTNKSKNRLIYTVAFIIFAIFIITGFCKPRGYSGYVFTMPRYIDYDEVMVEEKLIYVTYEEMIEDLEIDYDTALETYDMQYLELTGPFYGVPESNNIAFYICNEDFLDRIYVKFTEEQAEEVAAISKYDEVTIRGIVTEVEEFGYTMVLTSVEGSKTKGVQVTD